MSVRWEALGRSDVGRLRKGNEDAFFVDAERDVALVADGMGGHAAGEIASDIAAKTVGRALVRAVQGEHRRDGLLDALRAGVQTAQEQIIRFGAEHVSTRGMGTTVTACVLSADGTFRIAHVGDSRAYLFRGGALEQITADHTWVQQQISSGQLSPEAARTHPYAHVLTRVLSTDTREDPDLLSGTARPGDLLLLATDGLTGMLDDAEIAALVAHPGAPLDDLVDALIREANARGGTDNITTVLVRILEGR